MCGRTWNRMAAGADDFLPLWRDPVFAPTCRACLRILDSWFPAAATPAGVHLLAAIVAEEVERYSSACITGTPVEHVDAARAAIRDALRAGGFRSNTKVIDGNIYVWSDDAYQALDPDEIKKSVTGAVNRVMTGEPSDPDDGPSPIDWHTWVIDD